MTARRQRSGFPTVTPRIVVADAVSERAVAAGAVSLEAPFDTPYGDRRGMVRDPFGNVWQIAHAL